MRIQFPVFKSAPSVIAFLVHTTILIKVSRGTFERLLLFWNSRATFHPLLIGRELFSSRTSYVSQQQMALPLSL